MSIRQMVVLAALGVYSGAGVAASYGFLVGVSGYPAKNDYLELPGATNDVLLMRDVLQKKGFPLRNLTILADRVPGTPKPTRSNILAQLDALVEKSKAGDFVYVHFSGHGAQQPARRLPPDADPEADGKSEIFLPLDVGKWNDNQESIDNAIVDYELVRRLKGFIEKGAFVWAVFDACHSASLMRSAEADLRMRGVPAKALGIPDEAWAPVKAATRGKVPIKPLSLDLGQPAKANGGGYVALYAAQPWQQAPELIMPRGGSATDPGRKPHGALTYTLAAALSSLDGVSYRQLGDYILQQYILNPVGDSPTPVYSGNALDRPVLGKAASGLPPMRQWPVSVDGGKAFLDAGALNDISVGAEFLIVPTPLSPDKEATGRATVVRSESFRSEISIEAMGSGQPLPKADALATAYGRLKRPVLNFVMRVARPDLSRADREAARILSAAIEDMSRASDRPGRIRWVGANEPADLRLSLEARCLWFLPPAGIADDTARCGGSTASPSIPMPAERERTLAMLRESLSKLGRAKALIKAAESASTASDGIPIEVRFKEVLRETGQEREIEGGKQPRYTQDDLIKFTIRNRSSSPIHLNVIYVASDGGVSLEFPGENPNNTIEPGQQFDSARLTNGGIRIGLETSGQEHILILAEPVSSQTQRDYSHLEQTGVAHLAAAAERGDDREAVQPSREAPTGRSRSGSISGFDEFMTEAMWGNGQTSQTTRSRPLDSGEGAVRMLSFEVVETGAPTERK